MRVMVKPKPKRVCRYGMPALRPEPEDLKNLDHLYDNMIEAPFGSGVYFLLEQGDVVYVGQAICILRRIGEHVGTKKFSAWAWVPVPIPDLLVMERAYIRKFNPIYNHRDQAA